MDKNMKIMESPQQQSTYYSNSKIIMKQVNSPGISLNYSPDEVTSSLTRKPNNNMHCLLNGGSLPRSMTLQSKAKVHASNDDINSAGQQILDKSCQQSTARSTQSTLQPSSSSSTPSTVTGSSTVNKSGSKLSKTITSPCLRKLRSTLFLGSRDSRRAPISVNNTTPLEPITTNDELNEDTTANIDDMINPPLSTRSLSTPALNLQLAAQTSSSAAVEYHPHPTSTFSHSSTILHQQQHQHQQMVPIMANSMYNHYSGNAGYANQPQHQFNDSFYNCNNNNNNTYYASNDHLEPSGTYATGTSTPASCNYGYIQHQSVYSNQSSNGLPQVHQQHHLTPRINNNQNNQYQHHQCPPPRIGANSTENIYNTNQKTIGPQQQYHQQPTIKIQSQHRFVEVCRPEELRSNNNNNYDSRSSTNLNSNKTKADQDTSAILGSHIVVVSSYENNQTHGLTVKNSATSQHNATSVDVDHHLRHHYHHHHQTEAPSSIEDDCKTDNALNHMLVTAGSPDLAYKSSSDSGRGTRTSESGSAEAHNSASTSPPLDVTSLDSDQADSHGSMPNNKQQCTNPGVCHPSTSSQSSSSVVKLDKMQADLQKILDDDDDELTSDGGCSIGGVNNSLGLSSLKNQYSRLPVVHESDSWVSDSSKTVDEKTEQGGLNKKNESNSSNSTKKKESTSISQQQSVIKGSSTINRNHLLLNGKSDVNHGSVNKNGLCNKKLTPTLEKSQVSMMNGSHANTANVLINGNNTPTVNGPNKTTPNSRPKLGLTHGLSNGNKYGGGLGKGCKLQPSKKWRHPFIEETASVTTIGLESVDDVDDLTSEYTANTDAWENHENTHVRKQLSGLENMYSEILNLLGSRMHGAKKSMHHSSSGKLNRRISGSVSSLSVASRDAFYSRSNKYLSRRGDDFDSKGARRLKRLEGHVITLARSVSQLSSEIRSNQCLVEDVQTLRKDVDRIQEQLRCFKLTPLMDGGTLRRSAAAATANNTQNESKDTTDKLKSDTIGSGKNNKLDKIKRFFGDEPPLRQFLKKLGYEKYASKFESEKIGLKELSALNEEKLIKLGIPMGPRVRILQELNKLHPQSTLSSNIYLV